MHCICIYIYSNDWNVQSGHYTQTVTTMIHLHLSALQSALSGKYRSICMLLLLLIILSYYYWYTWILCFFLNHISKKKILFTLYNKVLITNIEGLFLPSAPARACTLHVNHTVTHSLVVVAHLNITAQFTRCCYLKSLLKHSEGSSWLSECRTFSVLLWVKCIRNY